MNNCIALLPMKAHSERVPNKNIRPFCGEPLFYRVAQTLQDANFIEKILINTDSDKIADLATKKFSKTQIIQRPPQLQGDDVPMNSIIGYDLSKCQGQYFLQTHSTNPLLLTATLEKAWNHFQQNLDKGIDSLFSATRLQTRLYDQNFKPINHDPKILLKTQDLPPILEENSNFYFFTRSSFEKTGRRIGDHFEVYVTDKIESLDIDYEVDFKMAELAYQLRNTK